jgi:hypothetical protein
MCKLTLRWTAGMLALPGSQTKSVFKNPLLYSWAALAIGTLIVGWILFSRWQENRDLDRHAKEVSLQKQQEQDRVALEKFGGQELAIQNFYASPGAIRRGESVQLCYGVANAKTVKLEPQPHPVWPSYSRCVDVTPAKSTTYTLTIADAAGHTSTQSLEVKVR